MPDLARDLSAYNLPRWGAHTNNARTKKMKLTKPETELIRDALRMLRESVRDQIRSAQTQKTITENLEKRLHCIFALDEKLSKNN